MIGIALGHWIAIVREILERMRTFLHGADDVAVHAVAEIAGIFRRDEIAVVVEVAIQ